MTVQVGGNPARMSGGMSLCGTMDLSRVIFRFLEAVLQVVTLGATKLKFADKFSFEYRLDFNLQGAAASVAWMWVQIFSKCRRSANFTMYRTAVWIRLAGVRGFTRSAGSCSEPCARPRPGVPCEFSLRRATGTALRSCPRCLSQSLDGIAIGA